jgi:membrane-anchored protein YejM (alkaline phosphatase superfamily)
MNTCSDVFVCSVYCISVKINTINNQILDKNIWTSVYLLCLLYQRQNKHNKQSNTRQKHLNKCLSALFIVDTINRADEHLFRCFCLVFDCLLCLFWRWYNKQSRWTLVQMFLSSIWLFIENIWTSVHLLCLLYQRQNTHNKQSNTRQKHLNKCSSALFIVSATK